ncbi:MAG: hypothetical protein HQ567_29550 [Candidatus Nealsonbacteria bacterium]|nr:hypothetical protein [Candidatus Nealsonbacteria bacterium]
MNQSTLDTLYLEFVTAADDERDTSYKRLFEEVNEEIERYIAGKWSSLCKADRQDMGQEVLLATHETFLPNCDPKRRSCRAFLKTCWSNCTVDWYRKKKRREAILVKDKDSVVDINGVQSDSDRRGLRSEQLPPDGILLGGELTELGSDILAFWLDGFGGYTELVDAWTAGGGAPCERRFLFSNLANGMVPPISNADMDASDLGVYARRRLWKQLGSQAQPCL